MQSPPVFQVRTLFLCAAAFKTMHTSKSAGSTVTVQAASDLRVIHPIMLNDDPGCWNIVARKRSGIGGPQENKLVPSLKKGARSAS
jgi:hypothetical protein